MDHPTSKASAASEHDSAWATVDQEFRSLGDAELLEIYALSQSSVALSEIVRRHSPLVASVIRRLISNAQDAEDAYQATFLAMVLSVKKIRKPDSLAAWLYGVAYRSAKRVRSL
jgi:DNA-directed RNA polymerase specialized sigma24 family protein